MSNCVLISILFRKFNQHGYRKYGQDKSRSIVLESTRKLISCSTSGKASSAMDSQNQKQIYTMLKN